MNYITRGYSAVVEKLTNYPTLGSDNTNIIDMLVSILLVISPILQHYKGIGVNAGFLVLILCLPYIGLKLLFRLRELPWKNLFYALPLVVFQVYRVFAHGTTFIEMAHAAVLCGCFIAIALGGINLKYVARSAYMVAMAAGIGIILQSLCYYLFHFHLQLVATNWLLEESNIWVKLAQTGTIGVTGTPSMFYRPSAFFLEPSHMFLYFVPCLFMLMLSREMNRVKRISAIILSVGLILSTSGMGIALVAGIWMLQLGFSNGKENLLHIKHLFNKKNILRCIAFVMIFVVIAFSLPFMRYGILRIFIGSSAIDDMIIAEESENEGPQEEIIGPSNEPVEEHEEAPSQTEDVADENAGSTAISGRIERAISLVRYQMSGMQYIFGVSDSLENIHFNVPGFFNTLYKYGIIGIILSYGFYLCCVILGKGSTRWTAIIILGISLVSAHTHGTFYMLFYVLMLMDGIISKAEENGILSQSAEAK